MTDATGHHTPEAISDVVHTGCAIVGGGPAGMVLALLLARQGIDTTLLEAHHDFDRDFRGDTVHPSTLEVLDQIGLAQRVLALPHGKVRSLELITPERTVTIANLSRLKTPFPFVTMLPQVHLLNLLAEEAQKFPNFHLVLGANVQRLLNDGGRVCGVQYRGADSAWHEVRAPLTVAADGRFSKLRSLADLTPQATAPPMDVVWFRLPRRPGDPEDRGAIYVKGGHFAAVLDRADNWQIGFAILKGSFRELRQQSIEALRAAMADVVPWMADRVNGLTDWAQVSVLSVESSRLAKWHLPGLLFIGDAAHVMSPVGGVGINCAIQDAVEAANALRLPLKSHRITDDDLAAIQRRREPAIRVVQRIQAYLQRRIAAPALRPGTSFRPPLLLQIGQYIPVLRNLPAKMLAFGPRRVRIEHPKPSE
ncbi:MAG TPA: FAD-dependent oxidoreductase [Pirellulales bacterium]|nr:FAD-dependent oxidoreductase [Pirellulales bacterium]